MKEFTISVIIPAFGNQHALDLSLSTLASQTVTADEVIVVDDGSPSPITIPPWASLVRIDREFGCGGHRGSSAAKNCGANLAKGDYLCFADSDILHLPDALESLLRCVKQWEAEGHPDVLLNTMRVSLPDGYKDKYLTDLDRLMRVTRSANLLTDEELKSSVLCYEQNESLISRRFFNAIGGYDEITFRSWGFNNQDLDLRVTLAGGRVSSAIPRLSTGKRLHCFHQFHENHCDRQKARVEFESKWGERWSEGLFKRAQAMAAGSSEPTVQEAS